MLCHSQYWLLITTVRQEVEQVSLGSFQVELDAASFNRKYLVMLSLYPTRRKFYFIFIELMYLPIAKCKEEVILIPCPGN